MSDKFTTLEQLAILVLVLLIQAETEYADQYAQEQVQTERTL